MKIIIGLVLVCLVALTLVLSMMISQIIWFCVLPLLCVCCLWLLLRKTIILCLFPGCSWFFLRGIESKYCKEMSIELSERFALFREFLLGVQKNHKVAQSYYDQDSKKMISTLIENYQNMEKLTSRQLHFFTLIKSLKVDLENTMIITPHKNYTLWAWINARLRSSDRTCTYLEILEDSSPLSQAILHCSSIESILNYCFTEKNFFKSAYRWLVNDVIGTIEYIRSDLYIRFLCEEVIIEKKNSKIHW